MAKKISFGGICAALSVVCLLLVNVFATNKIFFTCIATIFIPICVIKCGILTGCAMWVASSAIAFLVVPDKMVWAAFSVLGFYTLLKGYIERLRNMVFEWALKLLYYSISFATAIFVFPLANYSFIWLLFAGGAIVFIIYDIALSFGITYIAKKLKIILKKD